MNEEHPWRTAGRHIGLWIIAIALIFVGWQVLLWITGLPAYVIPTPGAALAIIRDNAAQMRGLTWQTVTETFYGYIAGAVIGFLLAVVMAQIRIVHRLLYPALITSQAVPIVAIAAPLVIIFGFGLTPKLIIVAWIVFFPVVVNVLDGLASVDQDQINLARLLGGTRLRTFRHRAPARLHRAAFLRPEDRRLLCRDGRGDRRMDCQFAGRPRHLSALGQCADEHRRRLWRDAAADRDRHRLLPHRAHPGASCDAVAQPHDGACLVRWLGSSSHSAEGLT